MLDKFNRFLQKFMPFMTPLAVLLGVTFADQLHTLVFIVPWLFALMTFSGSLGSSFSDLKRVILHPLPIIICLVLLHFVMPAAAFGTGALFFPEDAYTRTGLILSFVIPTGITSLVWVTLYKGKTFLTLCIILVDTMIAPFAVPFILHLFAGASVEMNAADMMGGLIWMIVLPSIAGMAANQLSKGAAPKKLNRYLSPFSKLGIGVVVAINSSAIAPYLETLSSKLWGIAVTVLMLSITAYLLGFAAGKLMKEEAAGVISLTYNSGMRNISAGAVLAIAYFPAPVAVPVIMGMLFQQILAASAGSFLNRMNRERGEMLVNEAV
jgi:bile acid:Na+ symporter, BASS family